MKGKRLLILGVALIIIFGGIYFHINFFTKSMIVGTYINKNYNYTPFLPEIPYSIDTLRIFKDERFISSHWGEGQYKLSYSLKGTTINLSYKYEFGMAGYKIPVTRNCFEAPRLILYRPKKHHYSKVR